MQEIARAKLNLSLRVLGRRADGYHELESLVVFAQLGDTLTVMPAGDLRLSLTGPFASQLAAENDNLVLRAAYALQAVSVGSQGAHLMLEKNLPIASGMGGGSADAAAALRALRALWNVEISDAELHSIALKLGADVPVCLQSRPAIMRGIGERIVPLAGLPSFWMVLINPGVGISTADIFRRLDARTFTGEDGDATPTLGGLEELLAWLKDNPNDLQAPAISLAPVIGHVLQALQSAGSCRLARMSGAGATCFGLFAGEKDAANAAQRLSSDHPDWWIKISGCG
jgi:4-diphosphocytidyl-2-C-methyl-D-erythritol kinase